MAYIEDSMELNQKIQALAPLDFLIYPLLFFVCYVAWVIQISVILAMAFNNYWMLLTGFILIPVSLKLGKMLNVDPIVFGLVQS